MKRISTALLTTALVAPLFLGAISAKAEVTLAEGEAAKTSSDAFVTMKKKPTDPLNPNTGDLTINNASQIDFGTTYISGSETVYHALYTDKAGETEDGKILPVSVGVNDDRGTNAGWILEANASTFTNATDATDKLAGAYITLKDGTIRDYGNKEELIATVSQSIVLTEGEDKVVMNAEAGKGMGTTNAFFGQNADEASTNDPKVKEGKNPAVTLTIPGDVKKTDNGQYKSTITWTLKDEPSK